MEVKIEVSYLPHGEGLPLPQYATPGSAGMDLCAAVTEDVRLTPGDVSLVPTGLSFILPKGYEAQVRSRSGLAAKHGLCVLNSPGTIDEDYRGEVKVILKHHGQEDFTITRGMRIAQLVIAPVVRALLAVSTLPLNETTERGTGGFGSTGL